MDLKKDYEKLYQHWLNEYKKAELTVLNQEIFDSYKKVLNDINKHHEDKKNILRFQVFESYKQNLQCLFEDLLKIREIKITNFALALKDIEVINIIEAEKLLYQNLVSSIKGYKKVKAVSIFQEEDLKSDELAHAEPIETREIEESKTQINDKESVKVEITKEEPKEQIDLILIRFLKITPPLVGIDLLNYGPFEKDDIAFIPSQNANILIFEKFAEKVEVT
ncbi:MAG: DNA replication complex subunit Gins51 [Candidatus Hodarchaeales archaeon]|jgi:DNA replication initiation complex subunit (GINS family)